MTHRNSGDIIDRYPDLFDLSGDVTATQMMYDFQGMGPGWCAVMDRLCAELPAIAGSEFKCISVKSKMGSLRIAYRGGNDAIEAAVDAAKAEAWVTCMSCGAAGELTEVEGWWAVRCGRCAAE
jgi:hypothetical protein